MNTQLILICTLGSVIGLAVESLLSGETGLDFIKVPGEDRCGLLQAVAQHQPGTVILDDAIILEDSDVLVSLLTGFPEMRVVGVSGEDNWLHLFSRQDILVSQAIDFTRVVRSR